MSEFHKEKYAQGQVKWASFVLFVSCSVKQHCLDQCTNDEERTKLI